MLEICQLILISLTRLCVSLGRCAQAAFVAHDRVWAMSVRRYRSSRLLQEQVVSLWSKAYSSQSFVAAWDCLRSDVFEARAWCPVLVPPRTRYQQLRYQQQTQ